MRAYNVWMIENDVDDRYITDKYFLDNGYNVTVEYLTIAEDQQIQSTAERMPHLILMSGKYGLSLLTALKSHQVLSQIPVVILTEMNHPFEIADAYRLGASSVIVKPSTHELTKEKIETFSKYWFSTVELSPQI